MSQVISTLVSGVTKIKAELYTAINTSIETLRSNFSGTSFPSSPVLGQKCFRTDLGIEYVYKSTGWVVSDGSTVTAEVTTARGATASLNARLSVGINPDGTFKGDAPASDWWANEPDAIAYVDATSFTVEGDKTAIYLENRSLELTQTSSGITYVDSSSYASGTGLTTVVVKGGVAVDSGITAIGFGQPDGNQPYSNSMSNPMTTAGDIIVGGAGGTPERLDVGSSGKVLKSNGTTPIYDDSLPIADAGGTVDAITATYTTGVVTLTDKMQVRAVAAGANTSTTPTFAPNGLTAHTIVKQGGIALAAGDIKGAGHVLDLVYDLTNTRWELLNPAVSGGAGVTNFFTEYSSVTAVANTYTIPIDGTIPQNTEGLEIFTQTITCNVGDTVVVRACISSTLPNSAGGNGHVIALFLDSDSSAIGHTSYVNNDSFSQSEQTIIEAVFTATATSHVLKIRAGSWVVVPAILTINIGPNTLQKSYINTLVIGV